MFKRDTFLGLSDLVVRVLLPCIEDCAWLPILLTGHVRTALISVLRIFEDAKTVARCSACSWSRLDVGAERAWLLETLVR